MTKRTVLIPKTSTTFAEVELEFPVFSKGSYNCFRAWLDTGMVLQVTTHFWDNESNVSAPAFATFSLYERRLDDIGKTNFSGEPMIPESYYGLGEHASTREEFAQSLAQARLIMDGFVQASLPLLEAVPA